MKLLALSGSLRQHSTNTGLLQALKKRAPTTVEFSIYDRMGIFPIFSPDFEGQNTPPLIAEFLTQVNNADGLIISCPEYAHGIPGGLKNALDWLVSNESFPGKPVMIAHASHRGGYVLDALHEVLKTMSAHLIEDAFLCVPLMSKTPAELVEQTNTPDISSQIRAKLNTFIDEISKLSAFQ